MLSARATRGLEQALFLGLVSPLLWEWLETTSSSSRLSYALLVPALALGLALRALRETAPEARLDGARRGGTWALLAGATLLVGSLTGVFTLALAGIPLAAVAFAVRARGRAWRPLAPALAFLFLMVPPPMPLLDRINPFLVEASGQTARLLLVPFDGQVAWSGPTLAFRGWRLVVAEACSGSGTFLMLGALCAFLAALFRLRARATALLLGATLPLTLAVNGMRIASSALVIAHFGARAGEGLPHELLGQAVVVAGALLIALVVERTSARTQTARAR